MTPNKYFYNLFKRLAMRFDQYYQHICMVTNIDDGKSIFGYNSSIILSSRKYGIIFEAPKNIAELFDGKVGVMNSTHVTAYYGSVLGCEILTKVEYVAFKCDSIFTPITYCDLPQLYFCDIPQNTIRGDKLILIKDIILHYKNFYQNLSNKYLCFSEKTNCCEINCNKNCCKSNSNCNNCNNCNKDCCNTNCNKDCCKSDCNKDCCKTKKCCGNN